MIWLIITITLLVGISTYFIYRAYILAGVLADSEDYIKEMEELTKYMFEQIKNTHTEMKKIDHLGAFESDDESGTTFAMLKEVIDNLEKEFNGETKEEVK